MIQFPLILFDGHPIIKSNDDIILIDTGAPNTIHTEESLNFGFKTYSCSIDAMGLTSPKLSELLGMKITTLMGVDILSDYNILIDYKNEIIGFSDQELLIDGNEALLSSFMGIPIVELIVEDQKLNFFLDTGAKLSYLNPSVTNRHDSIGSIRDFYPGVGHFETDCFEIPTRFGESSFNVKYGNLPSILQMTLMLGNTDGIIGFDFFNSFKLVLDLQNQLLKYSKN
jgi:hypothetical protein